MAVPGPSRRTIAAGALSSSARYVLTSAVHRPATLWETDDQ